MGISERRTRQAKAQTSIWKGAEHVTAALDESAGGLSRAEYPPEGPLRVVSGQSEVVGERVLQPVETGRDPQQCLWSTGDLQVGGRGLLGSTYGDVSLTESESRGLAPYPEIDDDFLIETLARSQGFQGDRQPLGPEGIVARPGRHPVASPANQRMDGLLETVSEVGQLVDDARRRGWQLLRADDPVRLQSPEPVGEQVGGYPGQVVPQVGEPLRSEEELPHDEERPASSHVIECPGKGAVLLIGSHATLYYII